MTVARTQQKHYAEKHGKHSPQMQTGDRIRVWEDACQWVPDRAAKPG